VQQAMSAASHRPFPTAPDSSELNRHAVVRTSATALGTARQARRKSAKTISCAREPNEAARGAAAQGGCTSTSMSYR
jgi:hypothetical protein